MMNFEFTALLCAIGASGFAAGHYLTKGLKMSEVARLSEEVARLRNNLAQMNWDMEIIRDQRNELIDAEKARRAKLREFGRKGALVSNAKKAETHRVSAATTIAALAETTLRPREEVVADVPAQRRLKTPIEPTLTY